MVSMVLMNNSLGGHDQQQVGGYDQYAQQQHKGFT
jgi:hypothetical protein